MSSVRQKLADFEAEITAINNKVGRLISDLDLDPVCGNSEHMYSTLAIGLRSLEEYLGQARKEASELFDLQPRTGKIRFNPPKRRFRTAKV